MFFSLFAKVIDIHFYISQRFSFFCSNKLMNLSVSVLENTISFHLAVGTKSGIECLFRLLRIVNDLVHCLLAFWQGLFKVVSIEECPL